MTEELKECPFCGGSDVQMFDQQGIAWVACSVCSTDGPTASTAEDAATVWNHRSIPPLIGLPVIDPQMLEVGK